MVGGKYIFVFAYILLSTHTSSGWSCVSDAECTDIAGSVCTAGVCACPLGEQRVDRGTRCAAVAPYYWSPCVEDHQCSRLFPGYQCLENGDAGETVCRCHPGHHYYQGRCWSSKNLGEACTLDQECLGTLRDPEANLCGEGVCVCADGYYLRQRGECRKSALAVGDECVLDVDCQFENGLCDRTTLTCYIPDANPQRTITMPQPYRAFNTTISRVHTEPCGNGVECSSPFVCSDHGVCVCPYGYYLGDSGLCLAELGSVATEETCLGLLAEVRGGVCSCPDNFYYDENMRDCVKAMIRFTDSCISDAMCHSFGAYSYCGPPAEPWGIRSCACVEGEAVWDENQNMCRVFAGIGEACEIDSDCLAGNVEILCQLDDAGAGTCTCPAGLAAVDGLCLTTGLALGDACQASQECGAENSLCDGVCSCSDGYAESGDVCLPTIGGSCTLDVDCIVEGTVCAGGTCQCGAGTAEYEDACWTVQTIYNGTCEVSAQCAGGLGTGSSCVDGACVCADTHHYRGGMCWYRTGLFEVCSRSTECYLGDITDRVVCRNGYCNCDFDYPYDEELHTCSSSSSKVVASLLLLISAVISVTSY